MKKLFFSLLTFGAFMSQAQTVHKCYSKEAIDQQQLLMPDYQERVNAQFNIAKQWSQNHLPTRDLYVIPVVFHVIHNTTEENLSDEILLNQLDILNQDYARLNPDSSNIRAEFQTLVGPTNVRFALAQVDPDGNPTSGITRTETTVESFGANGLDFNELEKVKATSTGGLDAWDQNRYLNIWVCDMSMDFLGIPLVLLLGYATPPDGMANWPTGTGIEDYGDGVVLQYQIVGDIEHNPNDVLPDSKGRTAVHEVGHYLGLRHIWGDGDCTMDDGIEDTPDATEASSQDCVLTKNTCNADVAGLGDLNDMVENFMDYSAESCQNSFTLLQTALMHGVLENERYDLTHNNSALTAVKELTSSTFNVYPNPANAQIKIQSENLIEMISVFDVNARILSENKVNGFESSIDIHSLEAGVYLVNVNFSNGQTVQKRITKK